MGRAPAARIVSTEFLGARIRRPPPPPAPTTFDEVDLGRGYMAAVFRVVRNNRRLMWLPVLHAVVAAVLFLGLLVVPRVLLDPWYDGTDQQRGHAVLLLGSLLYVLLFLESWAAVLYIATCCAAVSDAFSGRPVRLATAWRRVRGRMGALFVWSAVSMAVAVALRMVPLRDRLIGRFVAIVAGVSWTAVTFLVIPVLLETRMPLRYAVRRAAELLRPENRRVLAKAAWANIGLGLLLVVLAWVVPGVIIVYGVVLGFVLWVSGAIVGMVLIVGAVVAAVAIHVGVRLYFATAQAGTRMAAYRHMVGATRVRILQRG